MTKEEAIRKQFKGFNHGPKHGVRIREIRLSRELKNSSLFQRVVKDELSNAEVTR